jgi:hypothetical protein
VRWLEDLEYKCGARVDVVWLFENSRFYDMSFAGDRLRIYHQVDLNQIFHPATAARTASICFCTTDLIRDELSSYHPQVHVIHHGVRNFNCRVPLSDNAMLHFRSAGPHLVYAGNLGMSYLDVRLLSSIPIAFPRATLHLVGGCPEGSPLIQFLRNQPNVRWWGQVPSQMLPAIYERADALLVTYLESRWRDQASPHKLVEYLGSGIVTVATYTHQYRENRHLLAMADLGDNYIELLRSVLDSLTTWNAPARKQQRIAFAEEHSYGRQLDRILAHLSAIGKQI